MQSVFLPAISPALLLSAVFALPVHAATSCAFNASQTETAQRLLAPIPQKQLPGYLQKLASISQCQITEVNLPMARLVPAFSQGKTTLLVGMMQTAERDQLGTFYPLQDLRTYWISTRPPQADIMASLQRHDHRIGVVRGATFPSPLMQTLTMLRNSKQLDEARNEETAIRMVLAGRNKAFIAVDTTYFSLKKQNQLGGLSGWPLKDVPPIRIGVYLSRKGLNDSELARIETAIKALTQKNHVQQLLHARLGYQSD